MKQKEKLLQLLKPRSIAIIGASSTKGKVGNMIAKNVVAHDFSGDVYFINPRRKKILGKKSYPSLSDIEKDVDCAIVVVPAQYVEEVISDSAGKCKNFVVISAGFGEIGAEGHNREVQLGAVAKKHGVNVLGPNCLGFLAPSIGLNASFAEGLPREGHTALISQSGALAVAMMDKAQEDQIGFSSVISIGNKMQVGAAELVEYFTDDPETKVIALYLEGVVRGKKFLTALARAAKAGKKVIVLKSGRSEDAQKAIALHTGSLAGSDDVFSAALQKVGAVRAESMDDFFALVLFGAYADALPKGEVRVGVVTNAGGPGVLATDVIAEVPRVSMSALSQKTKNALQKELPEAASVHNPVDLLGDATLERYETGITAVLDDKNTDVVLVLLTPQDQTPVDEIAEYIVKKQKKTQKIIITSFIGGARVKDAVHTLRSGGVLHFVSPRKAINALSQLALKREIFALTSKAADAQRREDVVQIIDDAAQRKSLYFEEVVDVAKLYDINISTFTDISGGLDASMRIKYPCVAKVDNPRVLHKSDRGGVILPIKTLSELAHARKSLLRSFPEAGTRIIVQSLLPIKTELIIGMKRDPIFGVVVVAGLGGIYTEVFHMVEYFITPLSLKEIKHILKNGSLAFLFEGLRGEECYNIDMIAQTIYSVACIGNENPEVSAIDINPYLVYNNDTADVAVDFKILLDKS